VLSSPLRLIEISQIRRCLISLGRHQQAVRAKEVIFFADDEVRVAFLTPKFRPLHHLFGNAPVLPIGCPWPRQYIIKDGGEFMNVSVPVKLV
jgi:hypothetical protein